MKQVYLNSIQFNLMQLHFHPKHLLHQSNCVTLAASKVRKSQKEMRRFKSSFGLSRRVGHIDPKSLTYGEGEWNRVLLRGVVQW